MSAQTFGGIYPATLTPYTADGNVNGPLLKELVDAHLRAGVNGFYLGGGTGEGILNSVPERLEAVRAVMDQVGGRCRIIVHVGAVATREAVTLAKEVATMGVDAISALPPIFYRVPYDAIVEFYRQIADATDLPVLAYYIPGASGMTFTDAQFDELLAIENVMGVKFSDYDLFMMQQLITRHPDAVVMSGNDQVLLGALAMGAHGSIGLTLNIMPSLYVQLYEAYREGNLRAAQQLQFKANRLIATILPFGAGGIAALKPIMKMLGFDCGEARAPLPRLDSSNVERLHQQLETIDFFSDPIYVGWAKEQ